MQKFVHGLSLSNRSQGEKRDGKSVAGNYSLHMMEVFSQEIEIVDDEGNKINLEHPIG